MRMLARPRPCKRKRSFKADESDTNRANDCWKSEIQKAKEKHLPNTPNWQKDGYATFRSTEFDKLNDVNCPSQGIDRVHCKNLSLENFHELYEKLEKPVIIQGIPEHFRWKARTKWNLKNLQKQYGDCLFKCGDGETCEDEIKVQLKHFISYMKGQKDDTPLYIFDGVFDKQERARELLGHYAAPPYFREDLYDALGDRNREHRWFLVGPKRSGTSAHIDPLGTSAWNANLAGRKRWAMLPPGTPPGHATGSDYFQEGEENGPTNYFVDILPRIREAAAAAAAAAAVAEPGRAGRRRGRAAAAAAGPGGGGGGDGRRRRGRAAPLEFLQAPGETVFVPAGWWHAVLNLDDTVAVTQNYCSRVAFELVWERTRLIRAEAHKFDVEQIISVLTDESLTKQASQSQKSKSQTSSTKNKEGFLQDSGAGCNSFVDDDNNKEEQPPADDDGNDELGKTTANSSKPVTGDGNVTSNHQLTEEEGKAYYYKSDDMMQSCKERKQPQADIERKCEKKARLLKLSDQHLSGELNVEEFLERAIPEDAGFIKFLYWKDYELAGCYDTVTGPLLSSDGDDEAEKLMSHKTI